MFAPQNPSEPKAYTSKDLYIQTHQSNIYWNTQQPTRVKIMDPSSAALDPSRTSRRSPRLVAFFEKTTEEPNAFMEAAERGRRLQKRLAADTTVDDYRRGRMSQKNKAAVAAPRCDSASVCSEDTASTGKTNDPHHERDDDKPDEADESRLDLEAYLNLLARCSSLTIVAI
ncbi:hypothetical protein H2199_008722 [Coniosporium tulheliwenetii]|uniref:Uncharacterized protein n=1 Tax=Coniosporium tulheliwenetii TaxID=3383036 RepID=A0ACC2YIV5_9PEZI|nr:hypothetical protein H2199_008722 [Cladosporium sp. JES 115]